MLRSKRIKYTAEHLGFLRAGYANMSARDLAQAFKVKFGLAATAAQINSTLKRCRILCGRKGSDRLAPLRLYTPEQILFLRENYTGRSLAELTTVFNDRFSAAKTQKQIRAAVHNRGITSGRTGCFEKGHMPWNTGTKGMTAANVTSFKMGSIPPNRKPLGSERICPKDGFILVKIAERNPYTGFPTRYKHKHVHVWEQVHGKKVPAGMVVAFKDSDKLNCDPANLMLISRGELLLLNKHGYREMPVELKPSLLALAKLEEKTRAAIKGNHG
jgi:hypothetical protein